MQYLAYHLHALIQDYDITVAVQCINELMKQ